MKEILELYVLMLPVIIGGALNMVLCKSNFFIFLDKPMDGGLNFIDNQPIFGPNKTWRGFFGMILITCFVQLQWGFILGASGLENWNPYYHYYPNNFINNFNLGLVLGSAYVIFELPNSFIKRRLRIDPGKLATNKWLALVFFIIDQIDSLIGCVIGLSLLMPLSGQAASIILMLGAITHILVNQILYLFKLRKTAN